MADGTDTNISDSSKVIQTLIQDSDSMEKTGKKFKFSWEPATEPKYGHTLKSFS